MEKKELKELFERYLSGETTPAELKQLLLYFHQNDENEALQALIVQEMEKPVETDEATLQAREPLYERVQDKLRLRIEAETETPVISLWQKPFLRIIAFAAMALVVSYLVIWQFRQSKATVITVSAPFGKTKQITLPDSSHVWLNSGSRISYASVFNDKKRQVTLQEGQAFFDVIHKENLPFIVTVKGMKVAVLGTSFDVKAFLNENDIKVTVTTGKVGVVLTGSSEKATELLPNEQATLYKGRHELIKSNIQSDISAWRNNQLVFENETLDNIFHALERKYNVHLIVQRPTLLNEITSMKLNNQPISDVLTVLSFSKHFKYELKNDSTVTIR